LIGRGTVKIGKILYAPLRAEQFTGRLTLHTTSVDVDAYGLSFYGGSARGLATVDLASPGMPAVMTATIRGVDLSRIIASVAPRARRITGTLEGDLRISTTLGRNPRAALVGGGNFALRNGMVQGVGLQQNLAQLAGVLQLNLPAGDTRLSYFGGDLRIERERVHSLALRLDAESMQATARGSTGFDATLEYSGIGMLKSAATAGSSAPAGILQSLDRLVGDSTRGALKVLRMRVPFAVKGTIDDPKFSLAGTPQPLPDPARSAPANQQQSTQPPLNDLLDLFKKQ
jgi:hypothetical protein